MNKCMNVLKIHNEGLPYSFYSHKAKRQIHNIMPKREFLGWSPEMVNEVRESIINEYSKLQGVH